MIINTEYFDASKITAFYNLFWSFCENIECVYYLFKKKLVLTN